LGRAGRRILLKQTMAQVSKGGMDLRANASDQSWAVIAATRILYDILSGKGAARASQAAKWAHEFFENSLKRNPSEHKIECAKGCAHCCRVSVSALAPEIFHAANAVRAAHPNDFDATRARMRAAESMTHGLSLQDRARRKLPCVLLENNACSVYAARPGPCRGVTSISVKSCEIAFSGGNAAITTPSVWTVLRNAHVQAMWAALAAAELPSDSYELNEAICVALDRPDAEARWLKGEDVFRGVARTRFESPAIAEHNRKVIAGLVAGALGREMPGTG
jgi:Fe-S-cluster containining protein